MKIKDIMEESMDKLKKHLLDINQNSSKIEFDSDIIRFGKNIILTKPVNYLNRTILERYCKLIITDSGGVQPEAWYLEKKCIIMRSETEWLEPLNNNNNVLYNYIDPLNEFIESFINTKTKKNNIFNDVSLLIVKHVKQNNDNN